MAVLYGGVKGEKMPKIKVPIEMPCCCADCYFRGPIEELSVGSGFYRKISKCMLAPDTMEDPWKAITWQIEHREIWCPLEFVEEIENE